MSDPVSVLVGGATGQQGGAVARLLLEKGHRVSGPHQKARVRVGRPFEASGG